MAAALRDYDTPLFFLEACQTAQAEDTPTASVAGRLLACGVGSVAAMSHSVLVETARRFVQVFYRRVMAGDRVGQAMLAAQLALHGDRVRGRLLAGDLRLDDWFVPVLFQQQHDPQLITAVTDEQVRQVIARGEQLALGAVPAPPPHTFVGRSRLLLRAERILCSPSDGLTQLAVACLGRRPRPVCGVSRRRRRGQDGVGQGAVALAGPIPPLPPRGVRQPGARRHGPRGAVEAGRPIGAEFWCASRR